MRSLLRQHTAEALFRVTREGGQTRKGWSNLYTVRGVSLRVIGGLRAIRLVGARQDISDARILYFTPVTRLFWYQGEER